MRVMMEPRSLKQLKEGNFSTVLLAEYDDGFCCVWKCFMFHSNLNHKELLKLGFEQEKRMLQYLHHTSIPKLIDAWETKRAFVIAMEYIEGISLSKLIDIKDGIPLSILLYYALSICEIMIFLHEQEPYPILFADLKPQHLILRKDGSLALIDFGSAIWYRDDNKVRYATPMYCAPEIQNRSTYDLRSDIYSYGMCFYVLMLHRFPKRNEHHQMVSTKSNFLHLLHRCIQLDQQDRYSSFCKIKQELMMLSQC